MAELYYKVIMGCNSTSTSGSGPSSTSGSVESEIGEDHADPAASTSSLVPGSGERPVTATRGSTESRLSGSTAAHSGPAT